MSCQRIWRSAVSDLSEIDIWRAAYLMLRWYGKTAVVESARRAEELARERDVPGLPPGDRSSSGRSSSLQTQRPRVLCTEEPHTETRPNQRDAPF